MTWSFILLNSFYLFAPWFSSGTLVCFFFVYLFFGFFFATACTYCFRKGKDIVNVSVEGYLRKDQSKGKAREWEGERAAPFRCLVQGSLPGWENQKGLYKKEKKKGFGQKSKPKKCNGEPKGGIIYSLLAFFCLLRCLFSLKKMTKKKQNKEKKLLLLKIPGCVQVLLMFLEY